VENLRDTIRNVDDAMYYSVRSWNFIKNSVWDSTGYSVCESVRIFVCDSVGSFIKSSVRDSLREWISKDDH
jgi:hypothetical protein